MRRASVVIKQISQSQENLDENGNFENENFESINRNMLPFTGLPSSRSFSNFWSPPGSNKAGMSSRPSFISLMLIASDDDLSRLPRLPAPLQVESDTYQKCGWEDIPKVCSHLPILKVQESDEEPETHGSILHSIIHLPERMRKNSADKQRFNVYALPDQDREQLKNLYVY